MLYVLIGKCMHVCIYILLVVGDRTITNTQSSLFSKYLNK